MAAEQATILDVDALLDQTLDNVENVPDYVTPPEGNYTLRIKDAEVTKPAKAGEAGRFVLTLEVLETIEVKEGEMPVANGSIFSERFQATEDGLKYFKRAAKNYLKVESVDGGSVRDILAMLKQAEPFKAVITHTESKADDGKTYTNLRIRVVN